MTRRRLLWLAPPAFGVVAFLSRRDRPGYLLPSTATVIPKVVRSESEWRSRLTPHQFYVTRTGQTDEPFSGSMHRMHDPGLFQCICCDAVLFRSQAKYDSGTGWPSFREPIALENVRVVETPGLAQDAALKSGIEVKCARCDAHLGHIFGDGPAPGGLRYCINESALRFVPADA